MAILNFKNGKTYLDEEPFYIVSGDIHYFRIYPGGLDRRLALMKAFGLTTVQTYIPWNLHEPEKGQFCFDGLCDLEGFLQLVDKHGLKCLLRPSPYICSEWDKGGLPYWLEKEKLVLRSSDEAYMKHVRDYLKVLCAKFVPYLSTNGGPIIAVTVENEYGSYGNDAEYMKAVADLLVENGVDVPLYTSDGYEFHLTYGAIDGIWAGVNYRVESKIAIDAAKAFRPDMPVLIPEYWSGRAVHWGEGFARRNIPEVAKGFREALDNGGLLNFYMFTAGTNFGFMNGANFGVSFGRPEGTPAKYIPITTTYDVDTIINEQGLPTPKYFACRKELWDYLGQPEPPMPELPYTTQKPAEVTLTERADLFENLNLFRNIPSTLPLSMEEMDQAYGYCLYRTYVKGCGYTFPLILNEPRDRVDVFVDDKFVGTIMRDRENPTILIDLPKGKTTKIELLTENCGRINFGKWISEKKGLPNGVYLGQLHLFHWENIPLPFKTLSDLRYTDDLKKTGPAAYRGKFTAKPNVDTFLDIRGFQKGFVFVNGVNLGRYWNIGPQYTLYVPGELLKEENEIEIFEQYAVPEDCTVRFSDVQVLE